ncbi:MAG: hypothetical protein ACUVWX_15045, partial [Kiritimatiellia bacterium]
MSRIEDLGERFGEPVHILARERIGPEGMASVMELSLDRLHNLLFVNNGRCYDLSTGAVRILLWEADGWGPPAIRTVRAV